MNTSPLSCFSFLCRTKTCFGLNALENLPFDLATMGCRKPMIIQDQAARLSGAAKTVSRAFKDSGMTLGISPPIPDSDTDHSSDNDWQIEFVRKAHAAYSETGHDALIALGGALTLGTAKALNMAVSLGPEALTKQGVEGRLSPLIFIPQTAAAGLAATGRMQFNTQMFESDFLAPDQVIMAPELLIPETDDRLIDTALFCLAKGSEVLALSGNAPACAYADPVVSLADQVLKRFFDTGPDRSLSVGNTKKQMLARQKDLVQAAVMAAYLDRIPSVSAIVGEKILGPAGISLGQAMCLLFPALLETAGFEGGGTKDPEAPAAKIDFSALLLALSGPRTYSEIPEAQRPVAAVHAFRSTINRLYSLSFGKRPRTLAEAGLDTRALAGVVDELSENSELPDIKILLTLALTGQPATGI